MRILHTSDWHLGHTLHDVSRSFEHARFLEWLLSTIEQHNVDALLIAGDIFDTANPPTEAISMWYGFLAGARRRFPLLDIVAIGGNHDSAARLDAPEPLLAPLGVRVVGGVRRQGGWRDFGDYTIPLHAAGGQIGAVAVAVPFLRPADLDGARLNSLRSGGGASSELGSCADEDGDLIGGVRAFYERAFEVARAQAPAGAAIVAMGHLYLSGTALSELSERKILGGNQHALPASIFPGDVAYAALGHLHLAQDVGAPHVRYSGSPIPLSMQERNYQHQVVLVELSGGEPARIEPILVPRWVPFVRVPERGHLELEEALVVLAQQAANWPAPAPGAPRAFVEVGVKLGAPAPELRRQLAEALEPNGALARIDVWQAPRTIDGDAQQPRRRLRDHGVEDVFRLAWQRSHTEPPPPEVLAALHEAVDRAGQAPSEDEST